MFYAKIERKFRTAKQFKEYFFVFKTKKDYEVEDVVTTVNKILGSPSETFK